MTTTGSSAPSADQQTMVQKVIEWTGATGVVVLLLGVGFSKAAQNIGMALALLAVIAMGLSGNTKTLWQFVRNDRFAWLVGAWVLYLILLSLGIHWFSDIPTDDLPNETWRLSRLFLILLVAFWVSRSFTSPNTPLWLLIFGYLIGSLLFHHDAGWPLATSSRRLDLWENPQFYGLLSAAILLTLLIKAPDLIGSRASSGTLIRLLLWLATTILAVNGFLISEARGSMIGTLGAFFVVAGLLLVRFAQNRESKPRRTRRQCLLGTLATALIVGLLVHLSWERVNERFTHDAAIVKQAIEDPRHIERSSMGVRLTQWQTATPLWLERPLLGWGPGSGPYLHSKADLANEFRAAGSHFHNTYLDLMLWSGLTGLLLFFSSFIAYIRALWPAKRCKDEQFRTALLSFGVVTLFLIASLTQTFLTSQVSWFFLAGFLGTTMGLLKRHSPPNKHMSAQARNLLL